MAKASHGFNHDAAEVGYSISHVRQKPSEWLVQQRVAPGPGKRTSGADSGSRAMPQTAALRCNCTLHTVSGSGLGFEQEAWKKVELTPSTLADFWKGQVNSNAPRFKKLVRVARAVGGVPNVSAECERDFSAAKALLGSQRHGLLPDTVARKLFLMANRRMWQANPGVQLPA